jgi:hypothetical protein
MESGELHSNSAETLIRSKNPVSSVTTQRVVNGNNTVTFSMRPAGLSDAIPSANK